MNLYEKLQKVQNELKVPKDKNAMGKYKYRNADDIYENVKPLLEKYSLTLFVNDEVEMIGDRFYLKAVCVLTDGETTITSNAYAREPETVRNGMSEQQITGASSSYARKYALGGMFLIDNQDDVDSEEYQLGTNGKSSGSTNKGAGKTQTSKSTASKSSGLATKENLDMLKNLLNERGFTEFDIQNILKEYYKGKKLEQLTVEECRSFYKSANVDKK